MINDLYVYIEIQYRYELLKLIMKYMWTGYRYIAQKLWFISFSLFVDMAIIFYQYLATSIL